MEYPVLYCFVAERPPDLNDVHSLIRRAFVSKVAAAVENQTIYVASEEIPAVRPDEAYEIVRLPDETAIVTVACNVVFDSKREGIYRKEWRSHEAFSMFTAQAGLKSIDSEIYNLGLLPTHKFTIRTAFRITGEFSIVDRQKFDEVYFKGVGGRRSYGFGLMMVKTFI